MVFNPINAQKDTVLTYQVFKTKEKQCYTWEVPPKQSILLLLKMSDEISGREWNVCYGDWQCGVRGILIFKGQKYKYSLDACGWIILNRNNVQKYYGCRSQNCWQYYPSSSACDEEGNIID